MIPSSTYAAIATIIVALTVESGYAQQATIQIDSSDGGFTITSGGRLFTKVDIANYRRPILYPVIGPGGVPMTRNYPMKQGIAGEATDHQHHKSIWCGHGLINGVSFWHEEGKIVVDQSKPICQRVAKDGRSASISYHANYVGPDDQLVCTDKTSMSFHQLSDGARAIDWVYMIYASEGDLLFGDTKEGTMAIRTHPSLRIDKGAVGRNSHGDEGKGIWGKHAEWVDYSSNVEGQHVGVAIFDHPQNLRHPTTWHARDYGLVAANPFGLSHFKNKPKGTGDLKLPKGSSLLFKYRFVFHKGDATQAGIQSLYESYKKE